MSPLTSPIREWRFLKAELVAATDDLGQLYRPAGFSSSWSGTYQATAPAVVRIYSFPDIPSETKRLSFVFAAQPGREFTFRAKPEIATGKVRFN